ncbi:restriction endonuclease subunit S [Streptomyces parvus]|uniref:restriction endonuclease subunit S n=1 Tax=Streptomyces parvus TaxID=66428 RepID=UPI003D71445D
MTRFGHVMEKIDERIPGVDLPLMSVSQTRGVIRRSELTDAPQRAESLDNYKVCRANDIVFNKMSIRSGAMGVAAEDGLVTYHYEVMRPREGADPHFIAYLMKSSWFTKELIKRERGIGAGDQANVRTTEVPFSVLKTIDAYIPDHAEQRAISDYLDRETARIDTLIEEQQRLIEMLRARRQDLIRDAVLGAINPFSPPPDVAFTAIGYHFSVTLGKMLDGSKEARAGDLMLPYIRAGNIQDSGLRLSDLNQMPYSATEAASLNLLKGDLLVVEGGAVGTNVLIDRDMPGFSFQKTVNRLRPLNNWSSSWLGYVLRAYRDVGVIDIVCNKSTIPHLTAEKLRAMRIPLVQPQEQRRVATMLDQETVKIDRLITESDRFVELARERRSALITAAVTGQIDVRAAA